MPFRSFDELDEENIGWVWTQQQIDAGLHHCSSCDRFGWHTFCGECGGRYVGRELRWRECAKCKAKVASDWCSLCGSLVASDFLKRMERGQVDWRIEVNHSQVALEKMLHQFPGAAADLYADYQPPEPDSLAAQLKRGFGASFR